jgi:hypothetical protein
MKLSQFGLHPLELASGFYQALDGRASEVQQVRHVSGAVTRAAGDAAAPPVGSLAEAPLGKGAVAAG